MTKSAVCAFCQKQILLPKYGDVDVWGWLARSRFLLSPNPASFWKPSSSPAALGGGGAADVIDSGVGMKKYLDSSTG